MDLKEFNIVAICTRTIQLYELHTHIMKCIAYTLFCTQKMRLINYSILISSSQYHFLSLSKSHIFSLRV